MKKLFLSLVLGSSLTLALNANPHAHHAQNAQTIMLNAMHEDMMQTPLVQSSSVEKDFLQNMIPHHQGAIKSSSVILKSSQNTQIKKIAQNIIDAQTKEIAEFEELLQEKSFQSTKLENEIYQKFVKDEKAIIDEMMQKMNINTSNMSLEKAFLTAMISHHQGAIKLSEQILEYSKNAKIQKIAKNIIKAQSKEITEFKGLIEKMQ